MILGNWFRKEGVNAISLTMCMGKVRFMRDCSLDVSAIAMCWDGPCRFLYKLTCCSSPVLVCSGEKTINLLGTAVVRRLVPLFYHYMGINLGRSLCRMLGRLCRYRWAATGDELCLRETPPGRL